MRLPVMAGDSADLTCWLLEQLHLSPERWLWSRELTAQFPAARRELVRLGALGDERRLSSGDTVVLVDGRELRIVESERGVWGVDDGDPDAEPMVLTEGDVTRYQLDVGALATEVAKANGIVPRVRLIEPRTTFL